MSSLDHAAGSLGSIRIPAGVEVGDCSGRTIAAGVWNSHRCLSRRETVLYSDTVGGGGNIMLLEDQR